MSKFKTSAHAKSSAVPKELSKVMTFIPALMALSGCVMGGREAAAPKSLDPGLVAEMLSVRTPEYRAALFADSIPAMFRVTALQSAQFRRANKRWPNDRAELEAFFGESSSQAYRLSTASDGALLIGWETANDQTPVVVRMTTDYVISFNLLPAIEAAEEIRKQRLQDDARKQGIGSALSGAL